MKKAIKHIDLQAITYNYKHLKCSYNKNIIAVLKDNAYGCGLVKIAKQLQNEEKIIIAVKDFKEAILLRRNEIKCPILVLGVFEKEDLKLAKYYNVSVIVADFNQINMLKNSKVNFHLKLNSHMNRLGLSQEEFIRAYKICYKNKSYNLEGLMTHFATSDDNNYQYNYFIDTLKQINYDPSLIVHCFSSKSLKQDVYTNYVRVGLKLFGFLERSAMLKDAITLFAPVVKIIPIKKDEKVGYDFTYKAPSDGYIHIIPIGYGQGWGIFNTSFAFCDYQYLTQAGKNSMDFSAYFCRNKIKEDTMLELISLNVPIEHLSTLNNISIYQILTSLKNLKTIYDI